MRLLLILLLPLLSVPSGALAEPASRISEPPAVTSSVIPDRAAPHDTDPPLTAPSTVTAEVEKIKWEDLADVEWIWEDEFYQVKFGESAQRLDGQEVVVEGFMFPLEYTRTHTTFLVSASPMTNCFFCGPGEAESMILVNAVDEVEYLYTPIRLKGTFKLVHDASMGIIYEMEDALWVED